MPAVDQVLGLKGLNLSDGNRRAFIKSPSEHPRGPHVDVARMIQNT